MPERFPVKPPRRAKPQRFGTVFWLERGAEVLLVRRPASGLLGGMRALPTGAWTDAPPGLADAPVAAEWRLLDTSVSHGFTHFDLKLALAVARTQGHAEGEWWSVADLGAAGLPTLFAKAASMVEEQA
jgi:A/G-specific adenine glycosylase